MGLSFGPSVSREEHRTKDRMARTLIHQITPSQLTEQVALSTYSPVPRIAVTAALALLHPAASLQRPHLSPDCKHLAGMDRTLDVVPGHIWALVSWSQG